MSAVLRRQFQIGVLEHNSAGLATKLHEHGLQVLASHLGDNASNTSAAGKIDLLRVRMLD